MKKSSLRDEHGIAHLAIAAVVVLILVGVSGWFVYQRQHTGSASDPATKTAQTALKNVTCTIADKDLCKFYTSWKASQYFTMNATTTANDAVTTSVLQSAGHNYHITLTGDTSYETIGIGNDFYVKGADDIWWKQTLPQGDVSQYDGSAAISFSDPNTATGGQPGYTKAGVEKCDDLTCFKYQLTAPQQSGATEYIWFDNQNYQLRRIQETTGDLTTDSTFSYAKVTVSVPSPVKQLGANQYIVPGQSEPVTLPSASDAQKALSQALRSSGAGNGSDSTSDTSTPADTTPSYIGTEDDQ